MWLKTPQIFYKNVCINFMRFCCRGSLPRREINFEGLMSTLRGIYVNQTERFGLGALFSCYTVYCIHMYCYTECNSWRRPPRPKRSVWFTYNVHCKVLINPSKLIHEIYWNTIYIRMYVYICRQYNMLYNAYCGLTWTVVPTVALDTVTCTG